MKTTLLALLVFCLTNVNAQVTIFSENMGTPTGTTTIASNIFQNSGTLAYSAGNQSTPADIRNTSVSTTAYYAGASGGGNAYFSGTSTTYGFSIEGINASNHNTLSLEFAYRKESNSAHANFSVDYWNGAAWTTIGNTAATLFNELAGAPAVWYLSKTLTLPGDAQINGLKIRFVKTGNTAAIRIDDVKLRGYENLPTVINNTANSITHNSATFSGEITATGGASISATGTVFSATATNSNPMLNGSGVTALSTTGPNSGTGSFTNNSGTVLSPNVQYSYNAYATKSSGATGYGTTKTFYANAVTPSAPIISGITATTLNIAIAPDANAANTFYAIKEITTNKNVQSNGTLGTGNSYGSASSWGTKTITGLTPNTPYTFQVVAKGGNELITSASGSSEATTLLMPSISVSGTLDGLTTTYGKASTATNFTVTGENLIDSIILTAPSGFEISITNGNSGYAATQVLAPASGIIYPTTVYVRVAAHSAFGTYSGDVTLVSNGDGINTSVATAVSSVTKKLLALSGISIVNKSYDGNSNANLAGSAALNGVITTDLGNVLLNGSAVQANFADPAVGTGKNVTVQGYTLTGSKAINYTLDQPLLFLADITPNTTSDLVFNSSSPTSSNENIEYVNYQGTTLTSTTTGVNGSTGVMGLHLRDGGAGMNDADNLPTELTAITFSVTNPSSIKSARLFIGTSPRGVPVAVNGSSTITFTGLTNIIAADNTQLAINLRVTFNSNATDNEQIQFKVISVTAGLSGSSFAAADGGGATSSVNGDINRIEVIAERLSFDQQPPLSLYEEHIMAPSPSVIAKDIHGNKDSDFYGIITVTSTGTLDTTPQNSYALFGMSLFANIKHTDYGTGFQLTAAYPGLISATSNLFDIIALTTPLFDSVDPICVGGTINPLPTTSNNGITGSWSPAIDIYQSTNYTFTPDPGQNASIYTLLITVNQLTTPTFNPIGTITSGASLSPLPLTSLNGIAGSWSPALNNTASTTYIFTPTPGQCAGATSLTITVTSPGNGSNPTTPTYPTYPTSNSAEIGITGGELSILLNGSANYKVPITVPPGINGVTPEVSLSYNSQDENGLAGYGWSIAGISFITKIGSTKFHDNEIDAVDFDTTDRLALDGQRLILKSGTYGANGSVYETENFSNTKITAYGVHPQSQSIGPSYFIVEYPDGSMAHYGNSSDSKTSTSWAITYWQNPQGVRVNYQYIASNNNLRIFEVSYGRVGPPTSDLSNAIQFVYKDRQRPEQYYVSGQSIVTDKILDKIYVNGFGVQYKRYELGHDATNLGYERLISITEKTGDGSKSLNPTIFTYENTNNTISYQSSTTSLSLTGISVLNSATVSGDYDGDGKMDFVLYPNSTPADKNKFWVFTNIDGGSSNTAYGPLNIGKFEELFSSRWLNHNDKLMPMSGITSIQLGGAQYGDVSFNTYSLLSYGVYMQYSKVISFPNYNTGESVPEYNFCNYSPIKSIPKRYLDGDFNGDGLTDVIAIEKATTFYKFGSCNCCDPLGGFYSSVGQPINYTGGKTYFIDLDRRMTQTTPALLGNIIINNDSKVYVADANGDGKSDIYVFNEGLVRVYSINSSNQIVQLWTMSDANISISSTKTILLGDYNGDGKTDFIIPKGQSYFDWYKYMCTGSSFVKTTEFYSGFNYATNDALNTRYLIPTDFNNDGKTDLVRITSSRNQGNTWGQIVVNCIANINGQFNFQAANYNSVGHSGQQADLQKYALPIFYTSGNANRKMEVACIYDNKIHYFRSEKDFSEERLLKTITTGNGVKEKLTYSQLKQESCPYNCFYSYTPSSYTQNYPNFDIQNSSFFKVVTKLENQSSTVYKKQLYAYHGAILNFEGLGFLGFKSITKTNWHNDTNPVISTVSNFDTSLRKTLVQSYTALGLISPTTPLNQITTYISKITNTYNVENGIYVDPLQANKVFKLKLTSTQNSNGLENTSIESDLEYDPYNNPTKNTTVTKEGSAVVQTDVTDVIYDNQPGGPLYYIGRINSKSASITLNGDVMTSQELYSYNPENLISQLKKKGNQTPFVIEDNLYNSFGNLTKKTVTATGMAPREINYQYDPTGRFMTKKIDIEGLETNYNNNPFSGVLNYEIDKNGLKTSYTYDKWYKKIKETDYLLKNTNWTYTKDNAKTVVSISKDSGSNTVEIFDDLGRKIKAGINHINGVWAFSDTQYDIHDRKTYYSEPYLGTSASEWNQNQYNEYGKIISNTLHTGKITTTTYNGLITTVSDGTLSKASTKDALGNVIQVTDTPGGTINYTYFANNKVKTSSYNGATTTITQDGWGRRLTIDDPSAGLLSYTYNELGEIASETSQNGSTLYTYDDYGKLLTKVISGNQTNTSIAYQYNPVTKLLESETDTDITNGNTFTKNYFYDTNKKLVKTTEYDANSQFQFEKRYEFDSFGRIYREFFSATNSSDGKNSSKWIKHTYLNGFHWQILDDTTNAMLWQIDNVDARGNLKEAHYGNAIGKESRTYDPIGFPSLTTFRTINGTYASSTPFLSLTTDFNAEQGLLNSRSNSMFNWDEAFEYDNLNRLIEYTDGSGQQVNQTYNAPGTINTNEVGDYAYGISNKPYQVSTVTLNDQDQIDYYTNRNPQEVSYNAFQMPISINEDNHERIDFDYNQSLSRAIQYYGSNDIQKTDRPLRKYYSSDGTMEIKRNLISGILDFVIYIGGDGYSAPVILKSDGINSQDYYFLHRDYLGSILAITNSQGQVVEKRLFDAWGKLIKFESQSGNSTIPTQTGSMFLDRGYTGHEHLLGVGLINMNGRLYDPKLHRFLAPDNFVQDIYSTQNFNRYGYVLNNPLKYNDPSGEFLSIVVGFFEGLANIFTHGVNFNNYDWDKTINAWKIDMGLFRTDSNRTFMGQFLQVFSRFSWEIVQTAVGYIYSHTRNISGSVDEVVYFGGATFLVNENASDSWGISLGNYINVNIRNEFDEDYPGGWMYSEGGLFWHEYGHTFQSMRFGLFYLPGIGIPSALLNAEWTETSANRWAWRYANDFGYMQQWLYPVDHPLHTN